MYDALASEYCYYNLSKLHSSCFSGISAIIWSLLSGSDYSKPIFEDLDYARKEELLHKIFKYEKVICLCPIEMFAHMLQKRNISSANTSKFYCPSCGKLHSEILGKPS